MKGKLLIGLIVLGLAAFFGYQYLLGQNTGEDEQNVRASFAKLSTAISGGNVKVQDEMVSPKFADETLKKREDFIKVLNLPRKMYSATITNVQMQGDLAVVFYSRTERRGEHGKMIKDTIKGEFWSRDPANPKVWKLYKLAQGDKWFRSVEIPVDKQEAPVAAPVTKDEATGVLGTLPTPEGKTPAAKDEPAAVKDEAADAGKEADAKGEPAPEKPLEEQVAMVLTPVSAKRYNPTGKRDPFLPYDVDITTAADKDVCDPTRPKEYLEQYDLLSLKLQGIILMESDSMALVATPDGKGFTVRRNMYVGKNCGQVIDIEEERLLIFEKKKDPMDPFSDFQKVESELKIRPEEGT